MKELDDIAKQVYLDWVAAEPLRTAEDAIRSAIDKAIEFVLTREPSDKEVTEGVLALLRASGPGQISTKDDSVREVRSAMQAALLAEIKGK